MLRLMKREIYFNIEACKGQEFLYCIFEGKALRVNVSMVIPPHGANTPLCL